MIINTYLFTGKSDLRNIMGKKIGPRQDDIIYLGETNKQEHIYHINDTTAIVRASEISFVGRRDNQKDIEQAKTTLEYKLNIKLLTK